MAGTSHRLILDPSHPATPLCYRNDLNERSGYLKGADILSHTCHAIYLGAEPTPGRPRTIPLSEPWPLTSRGAAEDKEDAGAAAAAETADVLNVEEQAWEQDGGSQSSEQSAFSA